MSLQKDVEAIKRRNARVEAEKAWETSWTRRLAIAFLTYLVVVLFFYSAGFARPWVNALVPSAAFIVSTSSLPFIRRLWLRRRRS